MIYFKHYTDAHRGRSIQTLLDKFGHSGLVYWILVEMCADKLRPIPATELTEADCIFRFSERLVRDSCRLSATNVARMLDECATLDLLTWNRVGNELHIEMPKILECLDYDQKRARQQRDNSATLHRREKEKEKEKEKEIYSDVWDLDLIYQEYPKRLGATGKTVGMKKLTKIIKNKEDYELVLKAVKNYKNHCDSENKTNTGFVLQFSTFFGPTKDWKEFLSIGVEEPIKKRKINFGDSV